MAQIFISHSKKDKEIIDFFLESFAGTKVKPHLEELEKDVPSGITANQIGKDILASNALFVLLSVNVESLKHARDWVNWECGTAVNKDIWIFEPSESFGEISIVSPRLNHYVLFERTEEWRKYFRKIIESYDDSHVLPTLSLSTGSGALLNEKDRWGGAFAGFGIGLAGLILKGLTRPSFGVDIKCFKCNSNYKVHRYGYFRCPTCNSNLFLQLPKALSNQNPTNI